MNTLDLLKCAIRLRCQFESSSGPKTVFGTGFFVLAEPEQLFCLVTNRHLVDARIAKGAKTDLQLMSVDLALRTKTDHLQQSITNFVSLKCPESYFALNGPKIEFAGPDIVVYVSPAFQESLDGYWVDAIPERDLACQQDFVDGVRPMDQISFVGFPGQGNSEGWDTKIGLAIARTAWLASLTDGHFTNPSIKTSNVIVASGFSFSGSSGSPVILHKKTLATIKGDGTFEETHLREKVIGIMSGHWWEPGKSPAMFQHSGLSYLTRSSSICRMLDLARSSTVHRPEKDSSPA